MCAMRLAVVFSANTTLFDQIERPIARRLYATFPYGPLPTPIDPLCTHGFVIALCDGSEVWEGVEAVPSGTRHFLLAEKRGQRLRAYEVPCSPSQAQAAWRAARRAADRRLAYDFVGVPLAGWFALSGQPDTFWQSRHSSQFCTEGQTTWLRAGTIPYLVFGPHVVAADNALPPLCETFCQVAGYPALPLAALGLAA